MHRNKVDAAVFLDAAANVRPQPTNYAESLIDGYVPRNISQILSLTTYEILFMKSFSIENCLFM